MASSPIDIVKVFYSTLSLMSADKAGAYLAADFQLVGLTNAPLDRDAWIEFLSALKRALPDFKTRMAGVGMEGDQVRLTETGEGTHNAEMELSLVGLPAIPASGLRVNFFPSEWLLTIRDRKIVRAELISPPSLETGLPGMLKAFAQPVPRK